MQVGLVIALYSADNAVKSIDSAKYNILYSAANEDDGVARDYRMNDYNYLISNDISFH